MRYAPHSRLMTSCWLWAKGLVKEPDSQLFRFGNSKIRTLQSDQKLEEEAYNTISKGRYYPMRISDIIKNGYQVVGKLGYGLGSTVWLASGFR